jgi:hypothetical protein
MLLRVTAIGAFSAYCIWNLWWLAQARIPPSIFMAITGVPAPTTGGTRAILQLLQGNLLESLRYNCMAVPLLLLFLSNLLALGWLALTRRRLVLPEWVWWLWLAVLGIGWISKLCGDPAYW